MQIYKNLLVSWKIIMQTYFKSRLVKCHNMMQKYEGFFLDFLVTCHIIVKQMYI